MKKTIMPLEVQSKGMEMSRIGIYRNYPGRILPTVGSGEEGSVIAIPLEPTPLTDVLALLRWALNSLERRSLRQ